MHIVKCDICGKSFVASYGYSLTLGWNVTGSAFVAGYMCDQTQSGGQHWGCCPEHAVEAALNCLQNHMHVQGLLDKHQTAHRRPDPDNSEKTIQRPRYSDEDKWWAEKRGEQFHLIDF